MMIGVDAAVPALDPVASAVAMAPADTSSERRSMSRD
jgi:hypothetical protein